MENLSTEEKRRERFLNRKVHKEANNWGRRLTWVRESLKLKREQVSTGTLIIPPTTLADWECGIRTEFYEAIGVLARYYNQLWKEKYSKHRPRWNDEEVSSITVDFLLFGQDPIEKELQLKEKDLETLRMNLEMEIQARRQAEEQLRNQTDMGF